MVVVPRVLLNIGMKLISYRLPRRNFRPEDDLGIDDYLVCECTTECNSLAECVVNDKWLSCSSCILEFIPNQLGLVRKLNYPALRRAREALEYAKSEGLGRGSGQPVSSETENQEE